MAYNFYYVVTTILFDGVNYIHVSYTNKKIYQYCLPSKYGLSGHLATVAASSAVGLNFKEDNYLCRLQIIVLGMGVILCL